MNTELNTPSIVFVTVKVLAPSITKGTRMKVKVLGFDGKAKEYGYHDVQGFQQAAIEYMAALFPAWLPPKQANWQPHGKDGAIVALVY